MVTVDSSAILVLLLLAGAAFVGLIVFGGKVCSRLRPTAQRCRAEADRVRGALRLVSPPQQFGMLRRMDPFAFEELILTSCWLHHGLPIRHNTRYTGDGGVDGQVRIDGQWVLIQAKRYRNAINPRHVEEFAMLCQRRGCRGLFVHCGRTGPFSRKASGAQIDIVSGERLLALLTGKPCFLLGVKQTGNRS